ncbi:hypothetical protein P3T76_010661 [Phytophthora citrophthora]|uniref:Uncharacterized protein n=1 Tax=Phytophthora citrophthora TaxID=4793 RepID=A0AAD9LGH7_9STRA|nr:hypothetical protein P3T76_010661 [Phytophthora citrophthora]
MPHYFVIDARFSLSTEPTYPPSSRHIHVCDLQEPFIKSRYGKMPRVRSGSISIASLSNFPPSPVNRLAQSVGPERLQPTRENVWSRHTTPAMSTRRENCFFTDSPDLYAAKSNRRSVWRRFTENVDKCVFRVVSKFYR